MKKLLITFLILFPLLCLYPIEEKIMQLEQGEEVPFDCIAVPLETYKNIINKSIKDKKIINNQELQIKKLEDMNDLLLADLNLYKEKTILTNNLYKEEFNRRIVIEKNINKLELKNSILKTTTAIGLGVSFSLLVGIGIVALLYNTLPPR